VAVGALRLGGGGGGLVAVESVLDLVDETRHGELSCCKLIQVSLLSGKCL
jgi:hypothetical protein